MDFEELFKEMENRREERVMNKKMYLFRDYQHDDYYYLKLSDESANLLTWLIDEVELVDGNLIPMNEVDSIEF